MNNATAAGQLVPFYDSKGITLYCANYEEILPKLAADSFDCLLTDPPYGNTELAWDKSIDWSFFWNEAHRLCRPNAPLVLFACGKFVNKLINTNPKHYRYDLIWEKDKSVGFLDANRKPLRAHESILFFSKLFRGSTYNPQMTEGKMHVRSKGICKAAHYSTPTKVMPGIRTNLFHPRSVLRFSKGPAKSLHPTQKPLDLMKWLILTYTNRNDRILEPFAGSGSTLVAAAYHGREAIGIEQNMAYCDTIARRLEQGE